LTKLSPEFGVLLFWDTVYLPVGILN